MITQHRKVHLFDFGCRLYPVSSYGDARIPNKFLFISYNKKTKTTTSRHRVYFDSSDFCDFQFMHEFCILDNLFNLVIAGRGDKRSLLVNL